jgi:hypothetical protein
VGVVKSGKEEECCWTTKINKEDYGVDKYNSKKYLWGREGPKENKTGAVSRLLKVGPGSCVGTW